MIGVVVFLVSAGAGVLVVAVAAFVCGAQGPSNRPPRYDTGRWGERDDGSRRYLHYMLEPIDDLISTPVEALTGWACRMRPAPEDECLCFERDRCPEYNCANFDA